MVSGMSPSHLSRNSSAVCLMYLVLRLWKPTLLMKPFSVVGSSARTDSRLKPYAQSVGIRCTAISMRTPGIFSCIPRIATAVTVSFV